MAINQGLVLTCAKCSTKNFLDPYPFWNFERQHEVRRLRRPLCREIRQGPGGERTDGHHREGRSAAGLRRGQDRRRPSPVTRSGRHRRRVPIPSAESRNTSRRASGESRSAAVRSRRKISWEAGPGSSRTSTRPEEENSRGRDREEKRRVDLQVLRVLRGGAGPEHPEGVPRATARRGHGHSP